MRRRAFLGAVGGATSLAGCLGGGGSGASLQDHPAGKKLSNQPALGADPTESNRVIVAFEDPSCPSCARFERGTFPKLKSRLLDPGDASFVFRGIPVVQPWGKTAVHALEATFDRDVEAFWKLKHLYFQYQAQIGSQNVQSATRKLLGETSIEASAILNDVQNGTHQGEVDTDLQAARDADVQGTPTFHLFEGGSHATKIVGPQSYDVFASALGL